MATNRALDLIAGAGGAALIASLFLPWVSLDGASSTGWELLSPSDLLFLLAGGAGIAVALGGGWIGVFRPDVSLRGAADLLGVVSTLLIAWLLAFDFPAGAGYEPGGFVALLGAFTLACGAGDWRVLQGAPLFPRLDPTGERGRDDRERTG